MQPEDILYDFERQAHEQLSALELWRCPLRSILPFLILAADADFSGRHFGHSRQPNPERASTEAASRLRLLAAAAKLRI